MLQEHHLVEVRQKIGQYTRANVLEKCKKVENYVTGLLSSLDHFPAIKKMVLNH